jgi:hypothetical protein
LRNFTPYSIAQNRTARELFAQKRECAAFHCAFARENGLVERRQAFHQTKIIKNISTAHAQSKAEGISNRPAAKKLPHKLCSSLTDAGLIPQCGWRLPGSSGLR